VFWRWKGFCKCISHPTGRSYENCNCGPKQRGNSETEHFFIFQLSIAVHRHQEFVLFLIMTKISKI
jgi:hypothetical protein